jgi:transcription elongation factor Elf1
VSSFARKMKRRQFNIARKKFMKDFKSRMRQFKRLVKCSKCDYQPQPGENIDDWHIEQESNNIDLICKSCYTSIEEDTEEVNNDA